jgi:NAD-dependent dihydropyrimidine dehydrogenase PreA subunit
MPKRDIVKIDEEKCDGCGQCIVQCAEGALKIIDGKARLVSDVYCDGLGACLGSCPRGAITIEPREAADFDEAAVQQQSQEGSAAPASPAAGQCAGDCLGMQLFQLPLGGPVMPAHPPTPAPARGAGGGPTPALRQWPVQLALVRPDAPFLRDADLLLVADCAPLAMADFHARLLRGRALVIACPKLDDRQAHAEKLAAMFAEGGLRSLTIVHMQVPCCGGLNALVRAALEVSGRRLPVTEITVGLDGRIIAEETWP